MLLYDATCCLLDTLHRAIEDNVLRTCPDLVSNCVAVGHLKPCVVLLVECANEPAGRDLDSTTRDKEQILERTAEYNSRLLDHERITDPNHIVVVPAGSLPRTSVCALAVCVLYFTDNWVVMVAGEGKYQVSKKIC